MQYVEYVKCHRFGHKFEINRLSVYSGTSCSHAARQTTGRRSDVTG